ncbi:MAG: nitrate/nitrite transporter NrtS [Alphaproteobacteria bacterium]|jgi:hypothetical protein|nr:nitrate/nitrite transporter NrtS [Alphaproteobacteria bacterium]MDP6567530.1 nitrate/nitrite transporter NrtS [Alphaproteobacteria bacterium]MDP6813165.1 nitrate/nitrite transporter NrtS [Alphaproteobacteria bacterium]|tara:strand:- start:58 stop:321 length:264 start_codon:yes stop_codon:yes gene_type:complete
MTSDAALSSAPTLSQMAFGDGTPRKALGTALVVGTILVVINHGDVLAAADWPPLWKVLLTYSVPYCVATWGAITGKRSQWQRDLEKP